MPEILLQGICTNTACDNYGQTWDVWAGDRGAGIPVYNYDDEICPECMTRGQVGDVPEELQHDPALD